MYSLTDLYILISVTLLGYIIPNSQRTVIILLWESVCHILHWHLHSQEEDSKLYYFLSLQE